jgi:glycosyltransferase involved in cell wall biosynthesis
LTHKPQNRKLSDQSPGTSTGERFLFVLPWELDHIGGVNQVVRNLVRQFVTDRTAGAAFLSSQFGHEKLSDRGFAHNLHCYRLTLLNPHSETRRIRTLIGFILGFARAIRELSRLLVAERITTINFHYPSLSCLPAIVIAGRSADKVKVIFSFHGLDLTRIGKSGAAWRKLWSLVLKRVDAVVVCSNALGREFCEIFPAFTGKVRVIHNGVDVDYLQQAADKAGGLPDLLGKRVVLNAATLEYKKGQDLLIRSFANLVDRFPDLILVIMGRPAGAKSTLYELIDTLGLKGRAAIFEDVPHDMVLATMKNAELFVLPSRVEPFGIVLLEAAAFHLPVIATKTGGIVEVIEDGVNGHLVDVENADQLAAKMLAVLDGTINSTALADEFYERVRSRFTWKRAAAEYLRL